MKKKKTDIKLLKKDMKIHPKMADTHGLRKKSFFKVKQEIERLHE
jgi:hypothetical protein